jgi:hypothetical protein
MSRRPNRTRIVEQLVSPIRRRVRNPISRLRRTFTPGQTRWPVARWLALRRGQEARQRGGKA